MNQSSKICIGFGTDADGGKTPKCYINAVKYLLLYCSLKQLLINYNDH